MILLHRTAHYLLQFKIPVIPKVLTRLLYLLRNCDIPAECKIGKGTYLAHGGVGVVVNGKCTIGDRVSLGQGITIGGSFGSGVPIVGNDVWISAGARILGDVTIGNNVIIGANAVVLRDVPSNSVVAGVPARTLRTLQPGSLDTVNGLIKDIHCKL